LLVSPAIEGLPCLGLLLLLDEISASAAAREGNFGDAAALEVIPLSDVGALHG
jgi:hypothetical protein